MDWVSICIFLRLFIIKFWNVCTTLSGIFWWLFFQTSIELSSFIESPKVRQKINIITPRFWTALRERMRRRPNLGRASSGCFIKTMRQHIPPCLWRCSVRNTASPCWTTYHTCPTWQPVFFLFPEVKSELKEKRFVNVEAMKAKATQILIKLIEADFQCCFKDWKICTEHCRDREGEYIEDKFSGVIGDQ